MDTHIPRDEGDLSDVERQLAGWQPVPGRLDADAMLFAAGQAAGRRGRGKLLWPILCVLLAGQAAVLSVWGLAERAERRALAATLRQRAPAPARLQMAAIAAAREASHSLSPDGYFNLRWQMERDPNRWLSPAASPPPQAPGPPPPEPAILKFGQVDRPLD